MDILISVMLLGAIITVISLEWIAHRVGVVALPSNPHMARAMFSELEMEVVQKTQAHHSIVIADLGSGWGG